MDKTIHHYSLLLLTIIGALTLCAPRLETHSASSATLTPEPPHADALPDTVQFAAPTLFFTGKTFQKWVKGQGALRAVPASTHETKRFSCGLVGLKGELAKRTLQQLVEEGHVFYTQLLDPNMNVVDLLE